MLYSIQGSDISYRISYVYDILWDILWVSLNRIRYRRVPRIQMGGTAAAAFTEVVVPMAGHSSRGLCDSCRSGGAGPSAGVKSRHARAGPAPGPGPRGAMTATSPVPAARTRLKCRGRRPELTQPASVH